MEGSIKEIKKFGNRSQKIFHQNIFTCGCQNVTIFTLSHKLAKQGIECKKLMGMQTFYWLRERDSNKRI